VTAEQQGQLGQLELVALLALSVQLEHLEHLDHKEALDHQVQLVPQDQQVQVVLVALPGLVVNLDPQVKSALQGQLEYKALLARLDRLVFQEHQAIKDQTVNLDHLDQADQQVTQGAVGQLDKLEVLDLLAERALRVPQVLLDRLEPQVHLVLLEPLGFQEHQERRVLRDL